MGHVMQFAAQVEFSEIVQHCFDQLDGSEKKQGGKVGYHCKK